MSVELIQGDCLTEMRKMPDASFDLIFTSPPYNLSETTSGGFARNGFTNRKKGVWKRGESGIGAGYAEYNDAMPYPEYVAWQKQCLTEMWRLLSPTGAVFYNHKPRVQNKLLQTPLDLNPGLPMRQIVIWRRAGGLNYSPAFYLPTHEWIVIFAKPAFTLRDRGTSSIGDVWDIPQEANTEHPAPFPVELPRRAIATTTAQRILDPFCGSGSTGVAAVLEGRDFTGIELSEKYITRARKRIELAQMQQRIDWSAA